MCIKVISSKHMRIVSLPHKPIYFWYSEGLRKRINSHSTFKGFLLCLEIFTLPRQCSGIRCSFLKEGVPLKNLLTLFELGLEGLCLEPVSLSPHFSAVSVQNVFQLKQVTPATLLKYSWQGCILDTEPKLCVVHLPEPLTESF